MLICDKRRPRTRGDTNIRPPQGGRIKTAPPASGPRLGRSLAWGGTPPTPWAAPPARLRAPGPCCLVTQPEGVPARVRRWRGWATACGCPCPTPSPFPLNSVFSKGPAGPRKRGGVWGGVPPRQGGGGQPGPGGGRPGAAACGCARRPRTGRGCPRATGFRAER